MYDIKEHHTEEELENLLSKEKLHLRKMMQVNQMPIMKILIGRSDKNDMYLVAKNCTDNSSNQHEVDSLVEMKEKFRKFHYQIDQIMALNFPIGVNTDDETLDDLMAIAKTSREYNNKVFYLNHTIIF